MGTAMRTMAAFEGHCQRGEEEGLRAGSGVYTTLCAFMETTVKVLPVI